MLLLGFSKLAGRSVSAEPCFERVRLISVLVSARSVKTRVIRDEIFFSVRMSIKTRFCTRKPYGGRANDRRNFAGFETNRVHDAYRLSRRTRTFGISLNSGRLRPVLSVWGQTTVRLPCTVAYSLRGQVM